MTKYNTLILFIYIKQSAPCDMQLQPCEQDWYSQVLIFMRTSMWLINTIWNIRTIHLCLVPICLKKDNINMKAIYYEYG